MTRRPKGFDVQAWNEMGEHQRVAEVARASAIRAARRRYEGQIQRACATCDRHVRRAKRELEQAIETARVAYRTAEEADPQFQGGARA